MGKNILAIDDSPTLRASVKFVLSDAGYNVIQGENGLEGLEKLKEMRKNNERVNLIISDVNMPKMNGLEFLKQVKNGDSPDKFIPVIILTTESENQLKLQGKQFGASGWMTKPFKPELLLSVIKKFIR